MGNTINMNELEPISRPLLPIIFVLSTPGNMEGLPISELNDKMEEIKSVLEHFATSNPDALIKIGILQVQTGVHWIFPNGLVDIEAFIYNRLEASG